MPIYISSGAPAVLKKKDAISIRPKTIYCRHKGTVFSKKMNGYNPCHRIMLDTHINAGVAFAEQLKKFGF